MTTDSAERVTLCWPTGSLCAVVPGQWRRNDDGSIEATYNRNGTDELEAATLVMTAIKRVTWKRARRLAARNGGDHA